MEKCHICGRDTDIECRDCELPVCDNCCMPYNQFTQIDYDQCTKCGGIHEDLKAYEYFRQKQQEEKELKEKQIKAEKRREYYYSEKAI